MEEPLEQDEAMLPWELLPEYLKESDRRQVDHIRAKLQEAGYGIKPLTDWEAMFHEFEPEEVGLMARLEHERFVEERTREGWVRGPKKDVKKKTNPDLRPWEALSELAVQKNLHTVTELPKVLAADFRSIGCASISKATSNEGRQRELESMLLTHPCPKCVMRQIIGRFDGE